MGRPVKRRCRVCAGPRISTSFWPRPKAPGGRCAPAACRSAPLRRPRAGRSAAPARSRPRWRRRAPSRWWDAVSAPPAEAPASPRSPDRPWGRPAAARISRRSMPEQKPGPSPRTTTTRTSGFASSVVEVRRPAPSAWRGSWRCAGPAVHGQCRDAVVDLQSKLFGHATPSIVWSWGGAAAAPPPDPPTHLVSSSVQGIGHRRRCRAMTMRCTSDGPSPMRRTRASRYQRSRGNSFETP